MTRQNRGAILIDGVSAVRDAVKPARALDDYRLGS